MPLTVLNEPPVVQYTTNVLNICMIILTYFCNIRYAPDCIRRCRVRSVHPQTISVAWFGPHIEQLLIFIDSLHIIVDFALVVYISVWSLNAQEL